MREWYRDGVRHRKAHVSVVPINWRREGF
jgi:hypothetical protein